MRLKKRTILLGAIAAAGLLNLGLGLLLGDLLPVAGGAAALLYLVARGVFHRLHSPRRVRRPRSASPRSPDHLAVMADPSDSEGLVEQMLSQGRYTLLLRPQIAQDLGQECFCRALEALENGMALVPEGEVIVGIAEELDETGDPDDRPDPYAERSIRVAPYFLDRYPVTNRDFLEFVASGGYEQISLWDKTIWPAVLEFVDRTRHPGPRFWSNGCFAAGEEDHPVVGVCWHEASAYARWVGKRLPSNAEWIKAGAWPVSLSSTRHSQRKYPWGETMDRRRANLWDSGPGRTVSVYEHADGVSVGGVYQLIGNVWEWTSSNYSLAHFPPEQLLLDTPMKSLRGGAFDTYFDNQATCQFQTGDVPIARKHNIGFRCAINVGDLALRQDQPLEPPSPCRPDAVEEIAV